MDYNYNYDYLLEEIARQTNSELILFFVVVSVVLVVVFLPFYRMVLKERKERLSQDSLRQDKYIERERQIIAVITSNTEVIAGLKTTLELTTTSTQTSFTRIHDRLDEQSKKISEQGAALTNIQTTLEAIVRNQQAMSDDIKRGFNSLIREEKT